MILIIQGVFITNDLKFTIEVDMSQYDPYIAENHLVKQDLYKKKYKRIDFL